MRRPSRLLLPIAVVAPFAACSGRAPSLPPPQLELEVQNGGLAVVVRGEPGLDVQLAIARRWRGEHALQSGLVGQRVDAAGPADITAGFGVLLDGHLDRDVTKASVGAERLAAVPLPAVVQLLAMRGDGAARRLAVSNAFVLERRDGALMLSPCTAGGELAAEWRRLALALGVPLVLWLLLRRVRRTPSPRVFAALAAIAGLAAIATAPPLTPGAESGEAAPPIVVAPDGDAIAAAERQFGSGIRALLDGLVAARRGDEAVTILVAHGDRAADNAALVAAFVRRRVPLAVVTADAAAVAVPGLVLELAPGVAESLVAGAKTSLVQSPKGTLWRVEQPR